MKPTNTTTNTPRLLTLQEVADRLGVALWTVRRWASTRRIPTVKLGAAVRVDERDLNALIEARRRPAHNASAV